MLPFSPRAQVDADRASALQHLAEAAADALGISVDQVTIRLPGSPGSRRLQDSETVVYEITPAAGEPSVEMLGGMEGWTEELGEIKVGGQTLSLKKFIVEENSSSKKVSS